MNRREFLSQRIAPPCSVDDFRDDRDLGLEARSLAQKAISREIFSTHLSELIQPRWNSSFGAAPARRASSFAVSSSRRFLRMPIPFDRQTRGILHGETRARAREFHHPSEYQLADKSFAIGIGSFIYNATLRVFP